MNDDSDTQNTGANSSSAKLDFHKPVKNAAGRDSIDNSENSTQTSIGDGAIHFTKAETVTVVQMKQLMTSLTESTMQSSFFNATGIRCGPSARAQLETLMEKEFDGYALGLAWARRVLRWDAKAKQLCVKIGWAEYGAMVALAVIYASVILFLYELTQPFSGVRMSAAHFAVLCGTVMAMAIGLLVAHRYVWQPIATARQVRPFLSLSATGQPA